jgi:hypothetical protein
MDRTSSPNRRVVKANHASADRLCDSEASPLAVYHSRPLSKPLLLWRFLIVVTSLAWGLKLMAGSPRPLQGSSASGHPASSATTLGFSIRLKDGYTLFKQGETITLELGYGTDPRASAGRIATDQERPGLAVDELRLQPRTGVVDPLRDFLGSISVWDGQPPRTEPFVEERGPSTTVDLNEWFRFDKPGKYRLSVLAHPVRGHFGAFGNYEPDAASVTSNTVEFEIVPADTSWREATVQKAVALLATNVDYRRQREACRTLRFMAARRAVDVMIRHYADDGVCEAEYRDGLFGFPDREYAVRRMEDGILDPAMVVSAGYLNTAATLSTYLEHPEFVPSNADNDLGKPEWLMSGPLAGHWDLVEAKEEEFVEKLIGALGDKTGQALALCLKAIFDSPLLARQPTLLKSADAALLAQLRRELAEVFTDLPASEQSDLLWNRWPNIASPAMAPVLRRLYENPPPGVYEPQFVGMVLERLFEVAPTEGRALIIDEMVRPHPRFDLRFVRLLPDKEISELNVPLVESLEASNGQESTIVQLIGRYATPDVFARVVAVEADRVGNMPCEAQAAFLAYAFRSDPASGAELLSRALAARKTTDCYRTVLGDVARRQMAPEIEQEAVAHLDDPDLEVAASAVATLEHYGSAESEQPLWDRLRKWHSTWAGRSSELPNGYGSGLKNGLETGLELALMEALGTGQGWFAEPEKLGTLANLCVSPGGCQRAQAIMAQYSSTALITVCPGYEGEYSATVNQYQLDSLDSLKQKLAQFPKGTVFNWAFADDTKDGAPILAEIQGFLAEHGMTIR